MALRVGSKHQKCNVGNHGIALRSYYHCCCKNEPVIFTRHVHLKLLFHALLKVCSDCDDSVPLRLLYTKKGLSAVLHKTYLV